MSLDARWSALVESGRAEWRAGMLARLAPIGSLGRRWDIEAGTARHIRVLRAGAINAPDAVMVVTADGMTWPSGARVIDCSAIDLVPDWTDPATLGCLLGLVRERWGDPGAAPVYQSAWDTEPARWCVAGLAHGGWRGEFAATEAEALLAALEASTSNASSLAPRGRS